MTPFLTVYFPGRERYALRPFFIIIHDSEKKYKRKSEKTGLFSKNLLFPTPLRCKIRLFVSEKQNRKEAGYMRCPGRKTLLRYLPAALMLLCILVGIVCILIFGLPDVERVLAFVRRYAALTVPVLLALFALKGVSAMLPYSVLTTVGGLLFDIVPALLVNLAGTVICVTLPYLTGRAAKREEIIEKIKNNKKLAKYYGDGKTALFPLCFVLRTVGIQSEVLGLLFGNLGMPYLPFLAASVLGMLSTLVSYTVLGTTVSRLSPISLIFFGIDTAILIVTVLVYRKKMKEKAARERTEGTPPEKAPAPAEREETKDTPPENRA